MNKRTKILILCIGVFIVCLFATRKILDSYNAKEQAYLSYRQSATASLREQNVDVNKANWISKEELNSTINNIESPNKLFFENNEELVKQSAEMYRWLLSIASVIDFCDKHYEVKNLKREYNNRFYATQNKVEKTLLSAFGKDGFELLRKQFYINQNLIFEPMEKDYLIFKKEAESEGVTNFTKAHYCKFLDTNATDIMAENEKKFRTQFPRI